jgi:hypothetical protein
VLTSQPFSSINAPTLTVSTSTPPSVGHTVEPSACRQSDFVLGLVKKLWRFLLRVLRKYKVEG